MSKNTQTLFSQNPGLMYSLSLILIAAINVVVIYFANMFFPQNIVLGTMSLSTTWALILSGTALSVLTVLVMPLLTEWELRNHRKLSPLEMMVTYLVINFGFLWLISRAAEFLGLGISSWIVVLLLAVVLDFFQGAVMMAVEKMRIG